MRSIAILTAVLAVLLMPMLPGTAQQPMDEISSATGEGMTLGFVTVDGKRTQISNGEYLFIFVPTDGTAQPTFTQVVVGGISPGPTPPPEPDDVAAKVRAVLTAIQSPKKAEEAKNCATAIRTIIQQANAGEITTSAALVGITRGFVMAATFENATAWGPFQTVISDVLADCTSVPVCVGVLEVIAMELEAVK